MAPKTQPASETQALDRIKTTIYRTLQHPLTMEALKHSVADLGVTPARVANVFFTRITSSPELVKCDVRSLVKVLIEAAQLGLSFDVHLKQAHPVMYRVDGFPIAQLLVGYKGFEKLAIQGGELRRIKPIVIYEKDHFEYVEGLNPRCEHVFDVTKDRGRPIAVYSIAVLKNGERDALVPMLEAEINKQHRDRSPAFKAGGGPWVTDTLAMWRKTAIRMHCNQLPMDERTQRAVAIDERGEAGIDQDLVPDLDLDNIIETTASDAAVKQSKTEQRKEALKNAKGQTETSPEQSAPAAAEEPGLPSDEKSEPSSQAPPPHPLAGVRDLIKQGFIARVGKSKSLLEVAISEATGGKIQGFDDPSKFTPELIEKCDQWLAAKEGK